VGHSSHREQLRRKGGIFKLTMESNTSLKLGRNGGKKRSTTNQHHDGGGKSTNGEQALGAKIASFVGGGKGRKNGEKEGRTTLPEVALGKRNRGGAENRVLLIMNIT